MKNLVVIIVLILFLGLTSCTEGWQFFSSKVEYSTTVDFILNNRSDENANDNQSVHLWISGESIGPENKVEPGEKREIQYTLKNIADSDGQETEFEDVTVFAGRDGDVLTSLTARVNNISILARFDWDGTNINQY